MMGDVRASWSTGRPAYLATHVSALDWAVATPSELFVEETWRKSATVSTVGLKGQTPEHSQNSDQWFHDFKYAARVDGAKRAMTLDLCRVAFVLSVVAANSSLWEPALSRSLSQSCRCWDLSCLCRASIVVESANMGRTTIVSKESGWEVGVEDSNGNNPPWGAGFFGRDVGSAIWQANEVDLIQGDGAELTFGRPPQEYSPRTPARLVSDGGANPPTDSAISPDGL